MFAADAVATTGLASNVALIAGGGRSLIGAPATITPQAHAIAIAIAIAIDALHAAATPLRVEGRELIVTQELAGGDPSAAA